MSNREISKSKESEIELKSIYANLCCKDKGMYDGDEETQDIDSDINNDNIEGFGSYAGDININNFSWIEAL